MDVYPNPDASVFEISGRDTTRYLQGRCTQDLKSLAVGSGAPSLLLSPQGRIEGKFLVFKKESSFLIFVDPMTSEQENQFLAELFRFKVADDVSSARLDVRMWTCFSAKRAELDTAFSNDSDDTFLAHDVSFGTTTCSYLVLNSGSSLPDGITYQELSFSEFEERRVRAGVPKFLVDITNKNIAPDLPLDQYVSFTKGCYSGQEVVEMATARGRPNKEMFTARLSEHDEVEFGDTPLNVYNEPNSSSTKIGYVTSYVLSETNSCLGFLATKYNSEKYYLKVNDETFVEIMPS